MPDTLTCRVCKETFDVGPETMRVSFDLLNLEFARSSKVNVCGPCSRELADHLGITLAATVRPTRKSAS